MESVICKVLHRPDSDNLRFLPEGPYSLGDGRMSWVAIQHGPNARSGSINILDLESGTAESFELPRRPGFAIPTDRDRTFVCGAERTLGFFDCGTKEWRELASGIDHNVENTIINDGIVFDNNLIFGCKDLESSTRKAGLYLWRSADRRLVCLKNNQICSNGKAIIEADGNQWLIDIDSPDRRITRSTISIADGTLGPPETIVDMTDENVFPDGMIITPDRTSLIVAVYNPGDSDRGEARQYDLQSGTLQRTWICPGAIQVTCPQLVELNGSVWLILTTAVENMQAERRKRQPDAGCLFIGDTDFKSIGAQPVFPLP